MTEGSRAPLGIPVPNRTRSAMALVDLASVCPSKSEQAHVDALLLIGHMVRAACVSDNGDATPIREIECRIYGGFRDVAGQPTDRRAWLARHVAKLRGLEDGIRVVPTIAESIAIAPEAILIGTYANQRQVMVDAMIAEDICAFTRSEEFVSIILISNDDDFVPAVLSATRRASTLVRWVRQRSSGRNDSLLAESTVFLTDGRWRG